MVEGRSLRFGRPGKLARSRATPEDYGDFYAYHAPNVFRFYARHTPDPQVAFDLTAETFARAFVKREDFKGTTVEQAGAWLWRIVRNELARYQHSRSVEFSALTRLGLERRAPGDQELREVERLLALEGLVREHIPDALENLSPEHQQVIQLRFYEDLSNEEIAERLAVSNDVVRARISRALRSLRANQHLQSAIEILADT
jgi:RNA polymerase sigma-70 factor (ECF subfamily)